MAKLGVLVRRLSISRHSLTNFALDELNLKKLDRRAALFASELNFIVGKRNVCD